MTDCAICEHARREHYESGCEGRGRLSGSCRCAYVDQPPLPSDATAEDYRARSDWWDGHARTSWQLALDARHDLERWEPLMRFHRLARQAEIDHRLHARRLMRHSSGAATPPSLRVPYTDESVMPAQPAASPMPRERAATVA